MAIILTKDEKDPVGYAAQATQPAGAVLSVADGGGTIGGGGGAAASTANPGKSLANFPDVNAYLNANKDTAVSGMKNIVGGLVSNAEKPIANELNNFNSTFDQNWGTGTTANKIQDFNGMNNWRLNPQATDYINIIKNHASGVPSSFLPGSTGTVSDTIKPLEFSAEALKPLSELAAAKNMDDLMPKVYGQNSTVTPGMKALDNMINTGIPDMYTQAYSPYAREITAYPNLSKVAGDSHVQGAVNQDWKMLNDFLKNHPSTIGRNNGVMPLVR